MTDDDFVNTHKGRLETLFFLLPHAHNRYVGKGFFKRENPLNSLISMYIGNVYLSEDFEKKRGKQDDIHTIIQEAYNYILSVVDSAGVVYNPDVVKKYKEKLGIR